MKRTDQSSGPLFRIEVCIEPDGAGFHAYCPSLKGLHTCGDTEQEAFDNARDAAIGYLVSYLKRGEPLPAGIVVQSGSSSGPASCAKAEARSHYAQFALAAIPA